MTEREAYAIIHESVRRGVAQVSRYDPISKLWTAVTMDVMATLRDFGVKWDKEG